MFKRKYKLEIINDYIKILKLEVLNGNNKADILKIKKQYELLLFKIGLIDNALILLKNNFAEINLNMLENRLNKESILRLNKDVETIKNNLPLKLKILGLNEFEQFFVLNG